MTKYHSPHLYHLNPANIHRRSNAVSTSMRRDDVDVASVSEITPCNKIDKPLVIYRFSGNVTLGNKTKL